MQRAQDIFLSIHLSAHKHRSLLYGSIHRPGSPQSFSYIHQSHPPCVLQIPHLPEMHLPSVSYCPLDMGFRLTLKYAYLLPWDFTIISSFFQRTAPICQTELRFCCPHHRDPYGQPPEADQQRRLKIFGVDVRRCHIPGFSAALARKRWIECNRKETTLCHCLGIQTRCLLLYCTKGAAYRNSRQPALSLFGLRERLSSVFVNFSHI